MPPARNCGKEHHTVSARLKKIEQALGGELFDDSEHGTGRPTRLGRALS
jgi:DNA-binding transcriptional LysR family regulator